MVSDNWQKRRRLTANLSFAKVFHAFWLMVAVAGFILISLQITSLFFFST